MRNAEDAGPSVKSGMGSLTWSNHGILPPMPHYLGADIGTTNVKALLVDGRQRIIAQGSEPVPTLRRRTGWSEQHPEAWWSAFMKSVPPSAGKHPGNGPTSLPSGSPARCMPASALISETGRCGRRYYGMTAAHVPNQLLLP